MTDLITKGLRWVGARDTCVSKKSFERINLLQIEKFAANSNQRNLNLEKKLSSAKISNFEVSIMILLQKKDPELCCIEV